MTGSGNGEILCNNNHALSKTPRVEMFDQETKTNCVSKCSKVEGCTIPKITTLYPSEEH